MTHGQFGWVIVAFVFMGVGLISVAGYIDSVQRQERNLACIAAGKSVVGFDCIKQ